MAENIDPIASWIVALIAIVFGILSCEIAIYFTPPIPWQATLLRHLGIALVPACAFAFVAGLLGPRTPWRWCLVIGWSHVLWVLVVRPNVAVAIASTSNSYGYPLTLLLHPSYLALIAIVLVVATYFSLFGLPFAYAGAWVCRRLQRDA